MQEIANILMAVIIGFSLIVLTRFVIHKLFNNYYKSVTEIEDNNNIAIAIRNAGIYLGIGITMIGTIGDPIKQVYEGLIAMAFVLIAIFISDKIVFSKIINSKEIAKGNIALAISEFGLFVSTGIIAYSSFIGSGPFISSVVFFILGQMVFILSALISEYVYKNIKEKFRKPEN